MIFNKIDKKLRKKSENYIKDWKYHIKKAEKHIKGGRFDLYEMEIRRAQEFKKEYQEYIISLKTIEN